LRINAGEEKKGGGKIPIWRTQKKRVERKSRILQHFNL
jgi:hypothetical protein